LDALDILCAQLTRDLFAIAKFLLLSVFSRRLDSHDLQARNGCSILFVIM